MYETYEVSLPSDVGESYRMLNDKVNSLLVNSFFILLSAVVHTPIRMHALPHVLHERIDGKMT